MGREYVIFDRNVNKYVRFNHFSTPSVPNLIHSGDIEFRWSTKRMTVVAVLKWLNHLREMEAKISIASANWSFEGRKYLSTNHQDYDIYTEEWDVVRKIFLEMKGYLNSEESALFIASSLLNRKHITGAKWIAPVKKKFGEKPAYSDKFKEYNILPGSYYLVKTPVGFYEEYDFIIGLNTEAMISLRLAFDLEKVIEL